LHTFRHLKWHLKVKNLKFKKEIYDFRFENLQNITSFGMKMFVKCLLITFKVIANLPKKRGNEGNLIINFIVLFS